jgi:hypothetical protein
MTPPRPESSPRSSDLQSWYGLELLPEFLFSTVQIVAPLEIEPQIRAVGTQLFKPKRHRRRYRLPFLKLQRRPSTRATPAIAATGSTACHRAAQAELPAAA